MSWMIVLPIGFVSGIMFASAFPEMAQEINNAIYPTVNAGLDKVYEAIIDFIKGELFN